MNASQHDCNQVKSRILLALDGELSAEDEQKLMEDLKSCHCCLDQFELEKSFHEFMQARLKRKCCAQELAASIKANIKNSLFNAG